MYLSTVQSPLYLIVNTHLHSIGLFSAGRTHFFHVSFFLMHQSFHSLGNSCLKIIIYPLVCNSWTFKRGFVRWTLRELELSYMIWSSLENAHSQYRSEISLFSTFIWYHYYKTTTMTTSKIRTLRKMSEMIKSLWTNI